jgi:hypothetical protein
LRDEEAYLESGRRGSSHPRGLPDGEHRRRGRARAAITLAGRGGRTGTSRTWQKRVKYRECGGMVVVKDKRRWRVELGGCSLYPPPSIPLLDRFPCFGRSWEAEVNLGTEDVKMMTELLAENCRASQESSRINPEPDWQARQKATERSFSSVIES